MQKWKIVCIIMMLCAITRVSAQNSYEVRVKKYVAQFKDWAIAEQQRSGVPAAITLAQGIHETSAGNSELALNANNHFGIKCKKEWNGETYAYTDDAPDECFRKYPTALQSYKDHSDYLRGGQRYAALFKLSATDYAGWAYGLKRCGYATNPKYSQILIRLVEDYHLQEYTYAALSGDYNPIKDADNDADQNKQIKKDAVTEQTAMPVPPKKSNLQIGYGNAPNEVRKGFDDDEIIIKNSSKPEYGQLIRVNELKAFYAKKGTMLLQDAVKYNIRYVKLLELNDLPDNPLEADMFIYLEKKHPKGLTGVHIVKPRETLIQIAQTEGMQLKWLKFYNKIGGNEEPEEGAVLQLQQLASVKPATHPKVAMHESFPENFAGEKPKAIPQGSTRMRSGYISKSEIEVADNAPLQQFQTPAPDKVTPEVIEASAEKKTTSSPASEKFISEEPAKPTINLAATEEGLSVKETEETEEKISKNEIEKKQEESTEILPLPIKENEIETAPAVVKHVETYTVIPVKKPTLEKSQINSVTPIKEVTATVDIPVIAQSIDQPVTIVKPVKEEGLMAAAQKINEETPAPPKPENIASIESVKQEIKPATTQKITERPATIEPPKIEIPEEPKDEFSRLKAKLDRVVYASDNVAASAKEKKEEVKAETPSTPAGKTKLYTVKKGDTAFTIAKENKITMRQLMEWNKLDFKTIKVGQQLIVKQ